MTTPRRKTRGLGVLHVIVSLLIVSAVVRLASQAEPAMANEAPGDPVIDTEVANDTGQTGTLLAALQAREQRLVEREDQFRVRMQALRSVEDQVDEKLATLMQAEDQLRATIAMADTAAETDLAQLTTVYENMKPKEAADLFAQMPPEFAAGFLGLMRPDAAAMIMTELEPEVAYSFSVVLAGRNAAVPTN